MYAFQVYYTDFDVTLMATSPRNNVRDAIKYIPAHITREDAVLTSKVQGLTNVISAWVPGGSKPFATITPA